MKIRWIRGNDTISFHRPHLFFVEGVRGTGKSSLLEALGCLYLNHGHSVLDLFSSRDAESLAWLRSPYVKDKRMLLLSGENVDVAAPCDVKKCSDVTLRDFEDYDIVISSPPLYLNLDQEFTMIAQLMDRLYKRLSWNRLIYLMIREASNFLYSRIKLTDDQTQAKSQAVYMLREGRHCGLALGLDSVRLLSIDVDIRAITDYLFLKSQGMWGLPSDLHWLYSLFNPFLLRDMPPQFFTVVSKNGAVGVGEFNEVLWHKKERENLLNSLGIKVEYGEPVEKGEYRGRYATIGDSEHSLILNLYINESKGMSTIAKDLGRSTASIHAHIKRHDLSVSRSGFCPACRRVHSELETSRSRPLEET